VSKKLSFANLGSRLVKKTVEDPNPVPSGRTRAEPSKIDSSGSAPRLRQPDGRRGILVRARPEAWKALKQIALDSERTLQDVMTEAINDILTKNDKSPLA
jgi:hypothetical protein